MTETPQLYLITPPVFDPQAFAPRLAAVLDAHPVACLRLTLATTDETDVTRAADALRELAHARDVPLVITAHLQLVEKLGLDGVHLTDGARSVRKTRKELGADPIVGAFCAVSSHEGMTAGEAGADYIAFGPAGDSALGDGTRAGHDLFAWWSEMIELPVVAEGALDAGLIETLAPVVDFFAIGEEIWREDDATASLSRLTAPLR
ncbi:thiamine phosphate synthase [Rhodophyticola porphyridii]|uniref:thiamine phosphate synthase n=1 Tax=Rhodophyticola porphyridii TaxID=1852017 RepID=UPI0035CF702B